MKEPSGPQKELGGPQKELGGSQKELREPQEGAGRGRTSQRARWVSERAGHQFKLRRIGAGRANIWQCKRGLRVSQRVLDPVGRALEQAERALLQFRWPPSKL